MAKTMKRAKSREWAPDTVYAASGKETGVARSSGKDWTHFFTSRDDVAQFECDVAVYKRVGFVKFKRTVTIEETPVK